MANIFELKQTLWNLFDELEENGGELTEELANNLEITQEEFTNKVEDYTKVIKHLNSDLVAIKEEQTRLKELADRKKKVIDKLTSIIIEAINQFGDVKKSGSKFISFSTGEVSIRKSESVEVNETLVDEIGNYLMDLAKTDKDRNQLDVADRVDLSDIVTTFSQRETPIYCGGDDFNHINIDMNVSVPLSALGDGSAYNAFKEIAKYSDNFEFTPKVSKTDLKRELKENGSCAPNLAHIKINENLTIK